MNAIGSVGSGLGSVDLSSEISVRVAKKAMDAAKREGQAAVQLIQAAAKVSQSQPSGGYGGVGGALDVVG